ncbi:MAG: serine/threonine protein kinase, bacterial [Mycobacterium sp.]|nr:serine/threonine protein kinase, bacterial [Mycobacterium sp.]
MCGRFVGAGVGLSEGSVFADFVIERRLGLGGMGTVYAARHPRLPRLVALKVLNENLCSDPEFRARFEREAELAARVDHPNVVSVYDRGVEGDQLWIAMQYIDGVDVHQLIKRSRSGLTPRRAVFILTEAAKGLDGAHRRGLLHRDVKPANILVAEDSDEGDHVLVTDFGIARAVDQTSALTNAGSIAATLPFASPEQIASRKLDHRSDIYSLGCTFYTMLTGALPFPRDSQIAMMHAHLTDPPPQVSSANPAVPTEMDEVIARAMAKEPEQRYRSCREFASAAQVALLQLGSGAEPSMAIILGEDSPSQRRSDTSTTGVTGPESFLQSDPAPAVPGSTGMVASAGLADTIVPGHRPPAAPPAGPFTSDAVSPAASEHGPEKPRTKRGMIVGGAVLAVVIGLVIAGRMVFGGGQPQHTPVADTSSAPPAASTAAPAGPWEAYDFVAKALPGLMPDTPSGTAYQKGTCQPVNARFDPVDQLDTAPAVARIMCRPATGPQSNYIANYIVICSSDRTPQTLAGVADGLTGARNEQWSRGGGSGQVVYGTHNGAGAAAVSFDSPARNFCSVVANGNAGTSGQDVFDLWFRDAPL